MKRLAIAAAGLASVVLALYGMTQTVELDPDVAGRFGS